MSSPGAFEHFHLALAAAAMHMWSWDIQTGRVDWSEGIEALVGMQPGEFGGTFDAYQSVIHPDDREATLAAVRKAVDDASATYEFEHRARLPDGSIRWFRCRGQVVRDRAGKPLRMLGVVWDTTARKEAEARVAAAEAALQKTEDHLRMLVEQASDGIFLSDATRRFLDVNGAAEKLLGYTREELLALRVQDLLDPAELATRPLALRLDDPGAAIVTERRMRRKDGNFVDVEVSAMTLPGGLQQAFVRDITERKAEKAQLLQAERLASLGRLAAGVAHEINNPLSYVALNHELAEARLALVPAHPAVEDIRRALEVAKEGTERVRRIVRGLATFGRGGEEVVSAVDVHRALDAAIDIAENKIRHRARLTKDYQAGRLVEASELRLGQVFVNLLVNAVDAIVEGNAMDNEIRVATSTAPDGRVIVEVSDTGVGLPPGVKDRIFDPFFTTKPVGMGTGLGLSICHSIVTGLGGELSFESESGRGTTFRVVLPAATAPAANRDTPQARPQVTHRARILVIDDEPAIARVISSLLSSHDITVAAGGREGLRLAMTGAFDCILCDVMMPDLNGPELYEALRQEGRGLERRVVFMTGGAFGSRARTFLEDIPNLCIEKPFSAGDLEDAIGSVLSAETPPATYSVSSA